jgi:bifunctional UDP-N-acetylglucosamine pyrophosphorylase/glucosamine-1-phosphate N-acetyltransferase
MQVLLLAAGRSKRMQPIPDKNFLLFLGKPLIVHQLEALISNGFTNFIVVGGAHNLEKLKTIPKDFNLAGTTFQFIEQKNLDDGMAGAMLSCKEIIDNEPICVVSSNDVVDPKVFELMKEACKEDGYDSYIVGKKVSQYFPGGYLETKKDGLITGIIEKPGEGKEPSDLVNIVVHCHKHPQELLDTLENVSSDLDDKYEVALDTLIKGGAKMKAVEFDGFWQPIKYPWHVFAVMKYFLESMEKHIDENAEIAESAVVKGNVRIEEGAKIFENAVVIGPTYIGKNCIVATNALVRESVMNEGCVAGFATEIARSYLGRKVWTHTNYIGDSVISDNCSFGSGTVTGNLRLDEKNIPVNIKGEKMCSGTNKFGLITGENIRCGINTSFMPGIKIGGNSMIGAGLIIPQDIPENSFVKGKVELDIRENKASLDPKAREDMKKGLR